MKKGYLLYYVLILVFCACQPQERHPASGILPSNDYKKALSFLYKQNDSAFYYLNKVAGSSKDSLEIARSYNLMAAIQSDEGDYFGSQETLSFSLKYLNESDSSDRKCLASDYNELAMNSFNLKNFKAALGYFDQSLQFSDNPNFQAVVLNNKANALQRNRDYAQALKLYMNMPALDEKDQARILSNRAKTKWLQNPNYPAAEELLKGLQIRIALKDFYGQTSSYVHLSDYYLDSKPDSALMYAKLQYQTATLVSSPDDRLKALQKMIKLAPEHLVKSYFSSYQRLNDSVQTARSAAKNQFALIRYDAERIKAANFKLQKDNAENRYQLIRQRIMLYGAIILLAVALGWYWKRRQRVMLEATAMIKENELKISKKVHDVVANGLYQVMQEVQYQDLQGEPLVGKIDHLYRQSRNISHDIPQSTDDFHVNIDDLLQAFKTDNRKVLLVLNNAALWEGVNEYVRTELECVLKELMVNMSKHSDAQNVVIKFGRQQDDIQIIYTDDGKGMPANTPFGNGLTNTVSRIQTISGSITFEPSAARGLRVDISFPIA